MTRHLEDLHSCHVW